ncbi:MAG TPA: hypothetical protein VHH55_06680, partial [Gaiellaceae bacterium]|nr:hypothetical protein [Gaiellaceae bacterium]
ALEALADDARAVFGELPGGPGPPTPPGGSRSSGAAGRPAEPRRVMAIRIYLADSVTPPEVPNRPRSPLLLPLHLANPTSNSIYQRVGYRPVLDVDQWQFACL